jgi:exonuclease III
MLRLVERAVLLVLTVVFTYLLAEYQGNDHTDGGRAPKKPGAVQTPRGNRSDAVSGSEHDIRVMAWNVDWFQDPAHGPRDESSQYQGVKRVLQAFPMAIIGLVEVASEASFYRLVGDLSGYAGVLSTYRQSQKTGLLYATSLFDLEGSRPLSALTTAGRPPLEVSLRYKSSGKVLLVVVVHAKAYADLRSYRERERFSTKLKAYLDDKRADVPLIVLGDFNDLFYNSITPDMLSPYQNFVDDPKYLTATRQLNIAPNGEKSGRWGSTIDHIILSDELAPHLVNGSVDVVQREMKGRFTAFTRKISDHYPVTLTLRM